MRNAALAAFLLSLPAGPDAAFPSSSILEDPQGDQEEALKEYARRYREVDREDPQALLDLAEWARGKGLPVKEKTLYRKVLKLDPENETAHLGLGHVRFGGTWYRKAELEKIKAELEAERLRKEAEAREAARRAMLELPDEDSARKKVDQDLLDFAGESEKVMEAFVEETGAPESRFSVSTSSHCQVLANVKERVADDLARIGEYVYRKLNWVTFGKEDNQTFASAGGRHLFYIVTPGLYLDSAIFIVKNYKTDMPVAEAKRLVEDPSCRLSFYWDHPMLSLHIATTKQFMSSMVANGMGHNWLMFSARGALREIDVESGEMLRYKRGHLLNWLKEGVGLWATLDALGMNKYWRLGESSYMNMGREGKGEDRSLGTFRSTVLAVAEGGAFQGQPAKNFYQLSKQRLNRLSAVDLAMSFGVVDYLIRGRTKEWRKLVTDLKTATTFRTSFIRVFGTDHERKEVELILGETRKRRHLDELYRRACGRFEADWRKWVKETYPGEGEHVPPFRPVKG